MSDKGNEVLVKEFCFCFGKDLDGLPEEKDVTGHNLFRLTRLCVSVGDPTGARLKTGPVRGV